VIPYVICKFTYFCSLYLSLGHVSISKKVIGEEYIDFINKENLRAIFRFWFNLRIDRRFL
jgi:hypothetical protein